MLLGLIYFAEDAMLICRSVQMFSEKLIEEKIREAMERGEFDDLPGKGKPLDLDAYFATPEDVRLGYSVLKSAGCVPVEVELQKEIESLKARLDVSDDERERQSLRKEIEGKTLKLNLLMDGIQRARRERKG
jgi:DnaJ homologue, subfamily C, member 28, conserved domain